jgi:hypothetical protein
MTENVFPCKIFLLGWLLMSLKTKQKEMEGCRQLKLEGWLFCLFYQGIARTQSPTTKNNVLESPTFGVIAGVSPIVVQ